MIFPNISSTALTVKNFGAKGDGKTNDTGAINAAIAYGGRIVVPSGDYIIQPAAIDRGYALDIDRDDVHLHGEPGARFLFRLYDGGDPATNWPLVSGAVMRGHAIRINGPISGAPRKNISIRGIEIDGGAPSTGNSGPIPASPVDGDGWDITHKGIFIRADRLFDNIVIEDNDIHSFRGEVVHYGGIGLKCISIQRNRIGDTNGDCISVSSGAVTCRFNELYGAAHVGIENFYLDGYNFYQFNHVHDCEHGAFHVQPAFNNVTIGICDISQNIIEACGTVDNQSAMSLKGARNMRVQSNYLRGCRRGIFFEALGHGGSGTDEIHADNTQILDNIIIADASGDVDIPIDIGDTETWPSRNLQVRGNLMLLTAGGKTAGKTMRRGVVYGEAGPGHLDPGSDVLDNYIMGGVQDDDAKAIAVNRLLDTTGLITIATVKSRRNPVVLRARGSFGVKNSATTLSVKVVWNDANGITREKYLVTGSQPVDSFGSFNFEAVVGSASGIMIVQAQASTANNVSISARIDGT